MPPMFCSEDKIVALSSTCRSWNIYDILFSTCDVVFNEIFILWLYVYEIMCIVSSCYEINELTIRGTQPWLWIFFLLFCVQSLMKSEKFQTIIWPDCCSNIMFVFKTIHACLKKPRANTLFHRPWCKMFHGNRSNVNCQLFNYYFKCVYMLVMHKHDILSLNNIKSSEGKQFKSSVHWKSLNSGPLQVM